MLDNGGIMVQFLTFVEDFLFPKASRISLGLTHSPIQWVTEAVSYGTEQPLHYIHNPPASSTKANNALSYISTPPHDFMTWC